MLMFRLKRLQREVLGPVFETSVYVELLKCCGTDRICYWRTADKKENDFIVHLTWGATEYGAQFLPCDAAGDQKFPRDMRRDDVQLRGLPGG
jgi:hypothetical protein